MLMVWDWFLGGNQWQPIPIRYVQELVLTTAALGHVAVPELERLILFGIEL
jgi:hypothetical protein